MATKTTPDPFASAFVQSRVQEIIAAGKALGGTITPPAPFAPYTIIPEGYLLTELPAKQLAPLPDHIRQSVRLDEAESFVSYVKAFATNTTRIFMASASIEDVGPDSSGGAAFTAVLDYHQGGEDKQARRTAHVATYPVPLSLEFSLWLRGNKEAMSQMDFVNFIETNAPDVVKPDSATLMEMALNFEAKTDVAFQSKVDRVTGGRQLTYQEKVDAGAPSIGQVKVPESLTIRVPIFEGGKAYEIPARLEYRTGGGRLQITYHLQRPHDVFRTALKDLRQEIAEELEIQILTGEAKISKQDPHGGVI